MRNGPHWDVLRQRTRRQFLGQAPLAMGAFALASMEGPGRTLAKASTVGDFRSAEGGSAKSVIYLHMAGSPPQHELFDWKPKLVELDRKPCPEDLLAQQRFAFIKGHPVLLGSPHAFSQHGQSGAWVSELLPSLSEHVDDIAFIKSMHTDQFNHAPAQLLLHTGSPRFGAASAGAWVTYGLGTENENLPGFVVLLSGGTDPSGGKSLWGPGFLPSAHQGVQCRSGAEPILFLADPKGMPRAARRRSLDALETLNRREADRIGDPETLARIEQYELAYRMQIEAPETMDVSNESARTLEEYGAKPGDASFANNCLLARRLVERGVRYVQLFDWGWDAHGTGPHDDIVFHLPKKARQVDQPIAALLADLKRRGLLESTLVVWSGEFGRTSMNEARNGSKFLGRDHHPHCFTLWMAGGGVRGGVTLGSSDELGYFPAEDPVSVRDLQATVLHLLGLDAWRFGFLHQGLRQRLIGPTGEGRILREILS